MRGAYLKAGGGEKMTKLLRLRMKVSTEED